LKKLQSLKFLRFAEKLQKSILVFVELIAVIIDKKTENKILEEASRFEGKPIEIDRSPITVVGKKKFGVEGGAIIFLRDPQGISERKTVRCKGNVKDSDVKGTHFCSPNAKSSFRSWYGRRTREEINVYAKLKKKELKRGKVLGKMNGKNNPKTDEAFCVQTIFARKKIEQKRET
jgi:hypothetical protein